MLAEYRIIMHMWARVIERLVVFYRNSERWCHLPWYVRDADLTQVVGARKRTVQRHRLESIHWPLRRLINRRYRPQIGKFS